MLRVSRDTSEAIQPKFWVQNKTRDEFRELFREVLLRKYSDESSRATQRIFATRDWNRHHDE